MPGAPEPLYVLARRVLLDALEALGDQQDAVILVGAQAVYLHTPVRRISPLPSTRPMETSRSILRRSSWRQGWKSP